MTFLLNSWDTIKQTKTNNIISGIIKARKKEPDHLELNDLNDYSNNSYIKQHCIKMNILQAISCINK